MSRVGLFAALLLVACAHGSRPGDRGPDRNLHPRVEMLRTALEVILTDSVVAKIGPAFDPRLIRDAGHGEIRAVDFSVPADVEARYELARSLGLPISDAWYSKYCLAYLGPSGGWFAPAPDSIVERIDWCSRGGEPPLTLVAGEMEELSGGRAFRIFGFGAGGNYQWLVHVAASGEIRIETVWRSLSD